MPNENYSDTFITEITYRDHYYNHNFDSLSRALAKAGFEQIRKCLPGDSAVLAANGELYKNEQGREGDLIVEAVKLGKIPTSERSPRQWPKNPIAIFFARFFNLRFAPYIKGKAKFPSKYWLIGLYFNKWRKWRKKFPWDRLGLLSIVTLLILFENCLQYGFIA